MNDMLKKAVQKMQEKGNDGDMASGMKKSMDSKEESQEINCPHCGKGIVVELEAKGEEEDTE